MTSRSGIAPVRYGEHKPVPPGTPCMTCGATGRRIVTDHCHTHGWVRGPLCSGCNQAMRYIDQRVRPRCADAPGCAPLEVLLEYAALCPGCFPASPADLVPMAPAAECGARRHQRTVRLTPEITAEIKLIAKDLGITFNAATKVLLVEALKARGRDPHGAPTDRA